MSNARNIANLPNGDDAPIYACRAWVNFRGTSQTGTATASGLVTGLYTATVVTATQFTVEYSGTTYTINTSGNHEIGDGEGVDLTVSGTTVTIDTQIRKSGNVSSCQDNGPGDYTINFATAMPDDNYACFVSHVGRASTSGNGFTCGYYTTDNENAVGYNSNSVRLSIKLADSASMRDVNTISVGIFR